MRLDELTEPELIVPHLGGIDRPSILGALTEMMVAHGPVRDREMLYRRLEQREALGSTAIGHGVAVPHCKLAGLDRVVLAIATTDHDVDFDAEDGKPVRLFFLVISPEDQPAAHLKCLAAISRWATTPANVERILALDDPMAIYRLLGA